jgi:hypothetical protein
MPARSMNEIATSVAPTKESGPMRFAHVLAILSLCGCSGASSTVQNNGGASSAGGSANTGGTVSSGGSVAAGGATGDASVNCNCMLGTYRPACGVDGNTYDSTCGDACVPVTIVCHSACPCPTGGTGGSTAQGGASATNTGGGAGSGAGQPCTQTSDCGAGLLCCYPCGTAGCANQCMQPASTGLCPMFA